MSLLNAKASGSFAAFEVRWFRSLWLGGALWNLSRWGAAFLGAYYVNDVTDSPRLVQLTGSALWAPLLVGGLVGGLVSDRFNRRFTMLVMLVVTAPLTGVVAWLVATDAMEVWMVYPYLAVTGVGWVTDMTSRRAVIHDYVGDDLIDNAMAFEQISLAAGLLIGALVGGSVISIFGLDAAFAFVAVVFVASYLVLRRVPVGDVHRGSEAEASQSFAELSEGLRVVGRSSVVRSILGVTVITNLLFFAYFPIVQVIADDLGVGPFLTGLLAAATGLGMITGSLYIARSSPRRRGLAYVGGTFTGMFLLIGFAASPWYALAFAFLYASSLGAGFFGSMQSALVLTAVAPELRGRALGLLSVSIGALPVGMFLLGELAEAVGASIAVAVWAAIGCVVLVLWMLHRPEAIRIVAQDQ